MFKLPREAKNWFKNSQAADLKTPIFTEEWDLYYFCLLYGISEGKPDVQNLARTEDMSKTFTGKYAGSKYSLLTLLMMTHANRLKLDLTDKDELERVLGIFVDPDQDSGFSLKAIDTMNQYACAGFGLLSDSVPTLSNSSLAIAKIYEDLNKKMDAFAGNFN